MISLEMLGYRDGRAGAQRYPAGLRYIYPDTGDFIGLIGNLRTLPQMARLAGRVRDHVLASSFLFLSAVGSFPTRGVAITPRSRTSDTLQ